jgi:signal transduction histidine kinase
MSVIKKLVLLVFLPLFITISIYLEQEKHHAIDQSKRILDQTMRGKLREISSQLHVNMLFHQERVETLAKLLGEKSDLQQQEFFIKTYMDSSDDLIELIFMDKNSIEITRFNRYHVVQNKGERFYFEQAFYTYPLLHQQAFIGNFRISGDTGEVLFDIATLVKDKYSGEPIGVLKATYSGKKSLRILKAYSDRYLTIGTINRTTQTKLAHFGTSETIATEAIIAGNIAHIYTSNMPLSNEIITHYIVASKTILEQKVQQINERHRLYYLYFILVFIILFVIFYFYMRTLQKAVTQITATTRKFSADKNLLFYQSNDEVENLKRSITLLDRALETSKEQEMILAQQSKMAAMGEMLGNIAHQWRQPLNLLSVEKDLLIEDYYDATLDDGKIDKYNKKVTDSLSYLSQTIDDFRNYFAPDKSCTHFNLLRAVVRVKNIIEPSLKHHKITLHIHEPTKPLEVDGYENEFIQVVINLIHNAQDAIIGSKITQGIIAVTLQDANEHALILIDDNGGGIAPDILDKIFDPYFSTKFKSQGTGIGLYMSKMIIEKNMHGTLQATNTKHGARFTITLKKGKKDE